MLKILLVKTTSLGDLIHTMPAISDLQASQEDYELHWLVEESFRDIPGWHPYVKKVHTCAVRRWRKSIFNKETRKEIQQLKQALRNEHYDIVIDAQGLLKSAWMVNWLKVDSHGYDRRSIREPVASFFYRHKHIVSREHTAIERVRTLFAQVFEYTPNIINFGMHISKPASFSMQPQSPYAVFLHGTNWSSKVWPVSYWQSLAKSLIAEGKIVYLPWGNDAEKQVAEDIAAVSGATVLDKLSLTDLAYLIQQAEIVVGSDTGLNHIAAALSAHSIGLYGSTNSKLTGLVGANAISLQSDKDCSPCMKRQCPLVGQGEIILCYQSIGPEKVLEVIHQIERSEKK